MKISRFFKTTLPLLLLGSIATFSGVFALWSYFDAPADAQQSNFQHGIADIYYNENVPDDDEEELNHGLLLEKIASFDEGINNPDSLLSKAIRDRLGEEADTVSSNHNVTGGNLKNQFSNIEGFENVGFLIHMESSDKYAIYTYKNEDTLRLNVRIEAFKTYANLIDGTWILHGGYQGSAIVIKYDANTNGKYKNCIDPETWIQAEQ